eukprot:CAMPEP_0118708672 /NCGR_PEP_ID=MMETSP0800-20121206/22062_1 /TAXON_ID=210618 ORGANISM="Striatella unipunctata, Strain CCMP2910" /NCGR_SAMPLE_ID=MMETSP0800 /ASSEMBLY_ACC=CAM_ASM_000638 /LENGTH=458 /DNA_ID=CAMNT_0006611981 /DNA_START=66 /DNA_END=1439 /DNA_ORIENTATION=-
MATVAEIPDEVPTTTTTTAATTTATATTTPKASQVQAAKLREANAKYKNVLKLAKERIQAQEEEIDALRAAAKKHKEELEKEKRAHSAGNGYSSSDYYDNNSNNNSNNNNHNNNNNGNDGEKSSSIVKVVQRIRLDMNHLENDEHQEIWAFMEFEHVPLHPDGPEPILTKPIKRYKKWKRFASERALEDFIRRDTGEPIMLPPYSLTPEQSARVEAEAKQSIAKTMEEFRRFRVKSELARKQADATIRTLQTSNVQSTQKRIEGQDKAKELEQSRVDHAQVESLKNEMTEKELQWREAYDLLMAENNSLKSSGAEALLAAQWRQRFEACLAEKEDLQNKLESERGKLSNLEGDRRKQDAGKYELKYRDLKESFRLYRKKAKEIFEAQQRGDVGLIALAETSTEDAKVSYLKNLMVNYLSSDAAVREHMEGAIGTVLKFSAEDKKKIEKSKKSSSVEAW